MLTPLATCFTACDMRIVQCSSGAVVSRNHRGKRACVVRPVQREQRAADVHVHVQVAGCRSERTLMGCLLHQYHGGGWSTPSVFSSRFSVAKGDFDRGFTSVHAEDA